MSGNRSRRFSKGDGSTLNAYFRGKGASPTNHSWYQSSSDCPFVWYKNICSASFSFVTIHACDRRTDRRTDGQTELRLPRPLAYVRAVKMGLFVVYTFYQLRMRLLGMLSRVCLCLGLNTFESIGLEPSFWYAERVR